MAIGRRFEVDNFDFSSQIRSPLRISTTNFIELGWFEAELWRKPFSRCRPSTILNFRNLPLCSRDLCDFISTYRNSRQSDNITLRYGQNWFSIWRPAAVLNLQNFDFSSGDSSQKLISNLHTKFHGNQMTAAEICRYNHFQNGGRSPSWICYDVIIFHRETLFKVPKIVLSQSH